MLCRIGLMHCVPILHMEFTLDYTNMIARQLRFKGNFHSFWLGMNAESEHGNVYLRNDIAIKNNILTAKNPRSNTNSNDNILTAKIVISQLNEKPDYYK